MKFFAKKITSEQLPPRPTDAPGREISPRSHDNFHTQNVRFLPQSGEDNSGGNLFYIGKILHFQQKLIILGETTLTSRRRGYHTPSPTPQPANSDN